MMEFLINVIRVLPVPVALMALAGINAKRSVRVRQSMLPAVAIVYSAVALFLLYRFNDAIDSLIESFASLLPFLPSLSSSSWLYISQNVLLVLGFFLLKLITKPLFAALFANGRPLGQALIAKVYSYVPEYDKWFVEIRFGNLRDFYRALYWTSIGLTVTLMALALTFSSWPGFATVAFPAVAAMLIGEFYFAIDGLTKQEYDRDILGERDSSRRLANYGPLRGVLAEIFTSRILDDGVQVSSVAALDSGHRLGELSRSSEDAERLAGSYFERQRDLGRDIDVNLVDASVDLLRGSSVLVTNPFYSDLTEYLALPAYFNLLNYGKCLIVAGADSTAEDLVTWMEEGLESITGVPGLWQVEMLTALGRQGIDVGVLRFADVHNLDVLRNNDQFLQSVRYVILAEPSRMMATGQLGLGLLFSRCAKHAMPAYAAFDGNHDGLVDALSHLLKISLTEVVASAMPQGASAQVVWRADGPHMHSTILPGISRYLGVGTEIGAVALKYQVSKVHWVGGNTFPVNDMMWIAGQYYAQINSFADLELSQDALREALVPTSNPLKLPQTDNCFLVVEDEISNVYESIRRFSTRATSAGFVNLISENHLMRDYMVDNRDLFIADPKAVPSIVPDFARTERNAVLRIIMTLVAFQMSADDLAREFELIGWSVPDSVDVERLEQATWEPPVITMLRRAILQHTGITDVNVRRVPPAERHDVDGRFSDLEFYTIDPGSDIDEVVDSLRAAYLFVEDEKEDVNRIGALLYDHVYQSLLPGQFITYAGRYYEVQSISAPQFHNGVVLRRAADHIRDRRVYRPLRSFALSEIRQTDAVGATVVVGEIEVRRILANVDAQSLGYLELPSRENLEFGRRVLVSGIPARGYSNKAVLEIRLPNVPSRVRKTIALLLNELFVTTFPFDHRYVVALTSDQDREFGDLLDGLDLPHESESIFIVEDSMVDLGLVVAVERNWIRLLEVLCDYLAWNSSPDPEPGDENIVEEFIPTFPERPERPQRLSWWGRVKARLRSLRRRGSSAKQEEGSSEEHPAPLEDSSTGLVDPSPESAEQELVSDVGGAVGDEGAAVAQNAEDGDSNESK